MPRYIVQDTPVRHGTKGAKSPDDAETYFPGDEIELTEKEAAVLGSNVKPARAEKETEGPRNPEGMTKADIAEELKGLGVEAPAQANKADLVALLVEAREKAGGVAE